MHAALKGEMTIFSTVSPRNLTHIIAHEAACNRANILHRDISPGNILIFGDNKLRNSKSGESGSHDSNIEGGMLIDWDLSKIIQPDNERTSRQYTRTVS